ncbi:hypothetical protein [Kineosporia succinea]|uniref:Uncharacterized protein n=1 Tax=Kineosporia succinea TaxID=84632 RepID=A0ABT9NY53_9ACTN|nr:hypothetical protein [Kineosporia succinea]MDP9825241.1 hypothetical protein [Kineosporia succinea]
MAVSAFMYGPAMQSLANKEIDIDSDALKVMLCTSSYTPNQDTHRYRSSITNEITGTGYTAGGAALTGVTVAYNSTTNTLTIDCDDVTWATSTLTARYAVFYDSSPASDSVRPVLCYWDFGADIASSSGPFTLTISTGGLITWTVS